MASGSRKRVRYTFDVHFVNQEEKEAFLQRLKNVRQLLTPAGCPSLDNCSLFNALCDAVEGVSQPTSDPNTGASTKSFMRNSGKYCTSIDNCFSKEILHQDFGVLAVV